MPSTLKAIRVYLPPAQVDQLAEVAAAHGISSAEYIRRLLVQKGAIAEPNMQHGGNRHKK
jgi:hypothetical protein